MNLKTNLIKACGALVAIALMSVIYASQPAKTSIEQEQPQEVITSNSYVVKSKSCNEYCVAHVQGGDNNIYVEYKLDDGSVEFLDILNVVRDDVTVNAYVDRYEIEKINAAIVGGK
ncbi:hypothetical protein AY606_08505 [Acinetobacter sp. SFB]|uniref:hypothetical protein n=1 Tax=Acinetobacter sp. SFB TaxID=1805634 RepID=UPI0007D7811B|nr:hypothetical protein [Acinetobacter sp. SFB]OAL78456.1 hypothetical protein AY606_08505 [Acinetobacter sp. SFB]